MITEDRFTKRYTPEFVKDMAMRGNDTLSYLPRFEDFRGMNRVLVWPNSDGTVRIVDKNPEPPNDGIRRALIRRVKDYERVRITKSTSWDTMVDKVDEAIAKLGRRAEAMLLGLTGATAKEFCGGWSDEGLTPVQRWECKVALYSLGPFPRVLDCDGIVWLQVRPDDGPVALTGEEYMALGGRKGGGEERLKELQQQYGDQLYVANGDAWCIDTREPTYEVRIGYYANTGPYYQP